jgi:hypothetical protein
MARVIPRQYFCDGPLSLEGAGEVTSGQMTELFDQGRGLLGAD